MRSSGGAHYIGLAHIRALACLMVVTFHFAHGTGGHPVPWADAPLLLSVFEKGHTGVALFMVLSGYLFAKLLDDKEIDFPAFLWNRALRPVPLLLVVVILTGVVLALRDESLSNYVASVAAGVLLPTLPNGGWSITTEFHNYLILPLLLWMVRMSRLLPLALLAASIALRAWIYLQTGEVQSLAYWTLVGRIDQFVMGMVAFQFRVKGKHALVAAVGFGVFFGWFNYSGGRDGGSPPAFWIILPAAEGLAYSVLIAWYDGLAHSTGCVSRFISRIGGYSYSIYLLHMYFVHSAAAFVHQHVMEISSFYLAQVWALAFFLLMVPIGHYSYVCIEEPFLRLRKRYIVAAAISRTASVAPLPIR